MEKNHDKKYDLEERTFSFAKEVRLFLRDSINNQLLNSDIKQVIRASGSIGANYLEANNALSRKDFLYRMRISRKEAKECLFWLRLLSETSVHLREKGILKLIQEVVEIRKILSSIILKSDR